MAPGCATVSMVGAAGTAASDVEAASASPAQQQLRAVSADFAAHAEGAGWTGAAGQTDMAREAIDVLLHGRSEDAETAEAEPSAAELFVRDRAYDVAAAEDVAASLTAEIREARVRVRAVNAAAAQVVLGPERPAWARREDVRAAERVVQLARRSRTLFREVSASLGERLPSDERDMVSNELEALDVELSRLSAAADALSSSATEVQLREVDVIASDEVG